MTNKVLPKPDPDSSAKPYQYYTLFYCTTAIRGDLGSIILLNVFRQEWNLGTDTTYSSGSLIPLDSLSCSIPFASSLDIFIHPRCFPNILSTLNLINSTLHLTFAVHVWPRFDGNPLKKGIQFHTPLPDDRKSSNSFQSLIFQRCIWILL